MGVRITPTRYALGNGPVAAASCGTVVGGRDHMASRKDDGEFNPTTKRTALGAEETQEGQAVI